MSNEAKATLKEAREHLKRGEYSDAMKKCKSVLKKGKNNYVALVLLAAAMKETEEHRSQVPLALQKATEIQPDNPLAWQALVAFYEKEGGETEGRMRLATAYCKLLQLDSNSPKFSHMLNKLAELTLQLNEKEVLKQTVETFSMLRTLEDEEKRVLVDKTLAWILTDRPGNADDWPDLLESVLVGVVADEKLVDRQDYFRKYLRLLRNKGDVDKLVEKAVEMHGLFPNDICPLDHVCKLYYERYVTRQSFPSVDVTDFYESLLNLDADSESATIAKATHLLLSKDPIGARDLLNQLLASRPQSPYAWAILSEACAQLHCWEEAESATEHALRLGRKKLGDEAVRRLEVGLVEALSRSGNASKWKNAARMCERLMETESSDRLRLVHARTSVLLDDPDLDAELRPLESNPETELQATILRAAALKNQRRLDEAVNVLGSALESSEAWCLLGEIYWEMAEYSHSLMALLNGAKADPHDWQCLVYLGRYYHERGKDVERARRCYQKALRINPNSEMAGIGLSTAYRLLKNHDANLQLLQRLTAQDGGPKWAWRQLGLQQLDQGDAPQAIRAFQQVIRADPNDNHSWESLADAYLVRGAHTSALKSYQRALELSPGSLYPMIQLANIKLLTGQLEDARLDFKEILSGNPRSVPALKGLAEACLNLGRSNVRAQFLGRARENFQESLDSLTSAISLRSDLSCVWKLLGDVCYRVAVMSEKYCYLEASGALLGSGGRERRVTITQKEIFALSASCFCRALSISQDSALLWHDLACCYFARLKVDALELSEKEEKALAAKCLAAAKHAVKLCPSSWIHWNLLGVVCASPYVRNYALAQHAYVMAIDRELENGVVWTNLGTLYLHVENYYKANEAYSQAQRSAPSYINSWIGQALVAESMNRKEAMDLFRHSMELGYHDQAAVGYAHWVLVTLLNQEAKKDPLYKYMVDNMHAVAVATDALNWYLEHHPKDVYARNAYGLLLERQKLYRPALNQFSAIPWMNQEDVENLLPLNLARMLIRLESYKKAAELCESIKEKSFNSQVHLALALFKDKQYDEAYSAYEVGLQCLAKTETQEGNSLCAMAAIVHIFEQIQDVKTLLFQCIKIQPPVIPGHLAAATLGILDGDANLASLVLKELKEYQDHPEYGYHVDVLSAYFCLERGDIAGALAVLQAALQNHPEDARYWSKILQVLLKSRSMDFRVYARQALSYVSVKAPRDRSCVQIACAATLSFLAEERTTEGIRQAQKTLFAYPGYVESWATFVAACSSCQDRSPGLRDAWLDSLTRLVRDDLSRTPAMKDWLTKARNLSNETTTDHPVFAK